MVPGLLLGTNCAVCAAWLILLVPPGFPAWIC